MSRKLARVGKALRALPSKSAFEIEKELEVKSDFEVAEMLEAQLLGAMADSFQKLILADAIRRLRETD